jgi:ribonuclease P protein component
MLPKKNRISRTVFDLIFNNGKSIYSKSITLKYLKINNDLKNEIGYQSRFSFVAPSKIFKRSVYRNFLKRAGYNIIRKNKKNIKDGFVAVFLFKKTATKESFNELEKEILLLLNKAKILK